MISTFSREKIDSSTKVNSKKMASSEKVETGSLRFYSAGHSGHKNKPDFSDAKMTVIMNISFDGGGVDIRGEYHKDLAKMAALLQENSSLIVALDASIAAGTPAARVEVTRLRLKNIMDYLVNHFGVSYSRFYVAQLVRLPVCGDIFERFKGGGDDVTIVLKYPTLFS